MNIRYCIACEEEIALDDCSGHILVGDFPFEVDYCEGPFALVPPPVAFEDDWDLNLVEPTGDELFAMSMAADRLLADFGVE
jgi:hypothetical protein